MTDQLSSSQADTSAQTSPSRAPPRGVPVPEPEADLRSIAESSREREWRKPSFAKELYLGRFRLDLIHPHPTSSPEDVEHGESFLAGLRAFCEREVDGAADRARGADPRRRRQGPGASSAPSASRSRASTAGSDSRTSTTTGPCRSPASRTRASRRCSAPTSRSASRNRSSSPVPRSRSGSTFPAAPAGRSAPSCSPSRTSVPTPPGWRRRRRRSTAGGLRAQRGEALDDERRRRRAARRHGPRPARRRGSAAGSPRSSSRPTRPGSPSSAATPSWACADRERRDPLPPGTGAGREHRRRLSATASRSPCARSTPAGCRCPPCAPRRPSTPSRSPGSGAANGAGRAPDRRARGGGGEDRLHRGDHVRSRSRARPLRAHGRRGAQRHPDRGRARQALVQRDGLAGGGRVRADPRRARLRDGRVAGGAWETADPRRADAAGHADQPHLRGVDRDHAPADRPRGGRRPPHRCRRHHRPKVDVRGKARAAVRAGGFYGGWLPQLVVGPGRVPTSYREFGRLAKHLRYVERSSRKLARSTFYGMARWQGKLEFRQGFLGRVVDIGAELFAMSAAVRPGRDAARRRRERGRGVRARGPLLPAVPAARRAALRRPVEQHGLRRRPRSPVGL